LRSRQRQEPGWSCQPSAQGRPASSGCGRRRTALGSRSDICHKSDHAVQRWCAQPLWRIRSRVSAPAAFTVGWSRGRVRTSGCWQSFEEML
jgi:hypothetical protein